MECPIVFSGTNKIWKALGKWYSSDSFFTEFYGHQNITTYKVTQVRKWNEHFSFLLFNFTHSSVSRKAWSFSGGTEASHPVIRRTCPSWCRGLSVLLLLPNTYFLITTKTRLELEIKYRWSIRYHLPEIDIFESIVNIIEAQIGNEVFLVRSTNFFLYQFSWTFQDLLCAHVGLRENANIC